MAIASWERTLIAGNSPFDRWYYAQEENAIGSAAQRGFALFKGRARCVSCHRVNDRYALFTDNAMHNTGLGCHNAMRTEPEIRRILVALGVPWELRTDYFGGTRTLRRIPARQKQSA